MAKRVLILAPHTDDGEFGCGATIARLVEEGWEPHYVAFSGCKESLSPGSAPDILVKEVVAATAVLGVSPRHLTVLDFRVRDFPARRQDLLECMVKMRAELRPDLVLLPSIHDTHQDHHQVAEEGFRAFKMGCMLGYEMPWNNLEFHTAAFTILKHRHVQKKADAMRCYASQAHRFYANADFIWGLARTRGAQIGVEYAEAFEAFRWVM